MIEKNQTGIESFTKMHDNFINDWKLTMETGDTSAVERMADNYSVTFFTGNQDKPTTFSRSEAIEGMKQSVSQLLGAKKLFENRVIRLRNPENAVVFFEQVIEKDGKELSRLFTTENWRYQQGQWILARETEELI